MENLVWGLVALVAIVGGLLVIKFRIRPEDVAAEEAKRDKSWDDFQ